MILDGGSSQGWGESAGFGGKKEGKEFEALSELSGEKRIVGFLGFFLGLLGEVRLERPALGTVLDL